MKAYEGVDVQIHNFLTLALVAGEWSASRLGRFTPEERALDTHWIGGWVGPRAGLDDMEKRKFLTLPQLKLQPLGRPARSQSLYRLHYPGSLYILTYCVNSDRDFLKLLTAILDYILHNKLVYKNSTTASVKQHEDPHLPAHRHTSVEGCTISSQYFKYNVQLILLYNIIHTSVFLCLFNHNHNNKFYLHIKLQIYAHYINIYSLAKQQSVARIWIRIITTNFNYLSYVNMRLMMT
jgi:hypothetical protein